MTDFQLKERYGVSDLVEIVRVLRAPGGCPWDREQTHESIRKNLIEETYEVAEAIDLEDDKLLREELGDLLLQIALHARMEEEAGRFGFDDVANDICQKLILRHPHVFGAVAVSGTGEVLKNWEAIKEKTKGQTTVSQTLESVPKTLPALMRAQKVQHRAAKAGMGGANLSSALADLQGEVAELAEAIAGGGAARADELGDVLYAAANVARFLDADAEETLAAATERFMRRFKALEALALQRGIDLKTCGEETRDECWREAKAKLGT